jgi:hypothetical protein
MNTTETKNGLSPEQLEQVKTWLKTGKNGEAEFYWDYRDGLSEDQKALIMAGKIWEVENEIFENNIDYISDLEKEIIENALSACNIDSEEIDIWDLRDDLLDFISVNTGISELIKREEVNVRLTWYSNHDCINSFFFESSGGYSYEGSYFGDIVDRLNMNPKKVKELLTEKGVKTHGKWPDRKTRNGKEYVDYQKFFVELENQSCPACLLTIVGTMSLSQFVNGKPEVITIPAGNNVGLFSTFQGGGSPFDLELKRDLTINLKETRETKYDHWGLSSDSEDKYGIDYCYGVTPQFWGNEIKINKFETI